MLKVIESESHDFVKKLRTQGETGRSFMQGTTADELLERSIDEEIGKLKRRDHQPVSKSKEIDFSAFYPGRQQ